MSCRIRCAGIFIEHEKILLVKHKKKDREYYLLPGGGQEQAETQVQALVREWKEELDVDIEVGEFLFCGESFSPNVNEKTKHVVQMVFAVKSIKGDLKIIPDGTLFDFAWIPLSKLKEIVLFPNAVEQILDYANNMQNPLINERYLFYEWIP